MNRIIVNGDSMHWWDTPVDIPKGQANFSKIHFEFDSAWDGYDKVAQFIQGETRLNVAINNNEAFCPAELDLGTAFIAVRGMDSRRNTVIATANQVCIQIAPGFESGGTPPVPPTPDLYQELIAEFKRDIVKTVNGNPPDEEGNVEVESGEDFDIHGLIEENDLNNTDEMPLYSVSNEASHKTTWQNIKAKLKAYFDTLYNKVTKTSELTNDSGFLTQHQSLSGYATEQWVEGKGYGTYSKPADGIPKTDLAEAVQISLGKADSALQEHQDISGKADLVNGVVPASQLPSYVDDVLEYDDFESFPSTGESGKIYLDKDTNKAYRWGGTTYVPISSSVELGETSSTAYRGDRGKIAYDHSQNNNVHVTSTDKANWDAKADSEDIPTKTSELENDSGFLDEEDVEEYEGIETVNVETISIDTTVTSGSSNLITSGAVYNYIASLDGNEVEY